jgi:general secretion pathway protein G
LNAARRSAAGFTLIELMVVMAVLGVLALAAFPVAELTARRAKEAQLRSALAEIRSALDAYKRAYDEGRVAPVPGGSGFPPNLAALVDGVVDMRDPTRRALRFLRHVPADPFAPASASATPANGGWGLRSYASPPTAPAAGDDVYDVFSQSELLGLNGVPYREW